MREDPMRYAGLILLIALAPGCNRYKAELTKALAESQEAEAQKDSLLTEVLETTQFVSDLNSELAKAKSVALASGGGDPGLPGALRDRAERTALPACRERAGIARSARRPWRGSSRSLHA